MNWLKVKIVNWLHSNSIGNAKTKAHGLAPIESKGLDSEPMRLHIYRANGGTIVETRVYDRQRDRTTNQLHIIGHDQDLGQSLAKIITMESLRG